VKPHTEGAYWRYVEGCRCDLCRDANREYHRNYRHQRKYGKLNVDKETKKAPPTNIQNINLSIQPLLKYINHADDTITGERFGVTRSAVMRWKRNGVSVVTADRLACHIGVHPYIIWGNDYFKGMK
jgi:hypothetical protein